MHEINWRAVDVGLPAPVALPRPVKRVEGNVAYEANDARLAVSNDFQRTPASSLLLTFLLHSHIHGGAIH
jgi:hypothetical protein